MWERAVGRGAREHTCIVHTVTHTHTHTHTHTQGGREGRRKGMGEGRGGNKGDGVSLLGVGGDVCTYVEYIYIGQLWN